MTDHLLEKVDGGVATLTMNRPEARNAMTGDMLAALTDALQRHAADRSIRAVVLTGAGDAFCAGGDVKGFASEASSNSQTEFDLEERVHNLRVGMEASRIIHEMPKPTIAVIPGPAAGAGLSLALACDFRIAAENAKMTTAFAKVGLAGDYGGSYFLTQLVGAAKARELYLTADVITGAEAEKLGIVTKAVPRDQLEGEAQKWIDKLSAGPTIAMGYMKKNLNLALEGSLKDVLDQEAMYMIRTFMTEDHKGAAKAFVAKKNPEFNGR